MGSASSHSLREDGKVGLITSIAWTQPLRSRQGVGIHWVTGLRFRRVQRGVASRGAWPHRESRPRPVCAYLEPAGPRKSPSGSLENPVQTPGSGRGGVGGNRTESKPQAFATSTAHLPRAEAKGGGQQRLPLPCLRGAGKTRSDVSSAGVLPAVRPGTRCPSSQNLLGFLIWKVGGPRGEVL